MRAILVRVGADQTCEGGCWNAPVDPNSGEFVYIPIPERPGVECLPKLVRRFEEWSAPLLRFFENHSTTGKYWLKRIEERAGDVMHLDPDFVHLTYGDMGDRRGRVLRDFQSGDVLVFYSGLKSIEAKSPLIYGMIGLYVVEEIVFARDIPDARRHENAHSRRLAPASDEFIVQAKSSVSGRCKRCIPIGELRGSSYFLRQDIEKAWGGLADNKDGSQRSLSLNRSGVPPLLADPQAFMRWWEEQDVELVHRNVD